jgi:hypothetical protein
MDLTFEANRIEKSVRVAGIKICNQRDTVTLTEDKEDACGYSQPIRL